VSFTSCTPILLISPSQHTCPSPLQYSLQQKKYTCGYIHTHTHTHTNTHTHMCIHTHTHRHTHTHTYIVKVVMCSTVSLCPPFFVCKFQQPVMSRFRSGVLSSTATGSHIWFCGLPAARICYHQRPGLGCLWGILMSEGCAELVPLFT
jgi:hypothetical protein